MSTKSSDKEYSKLSEKAPEWSVGIILYKGNAYPLAKSKFVKDEYYFSTNWRPVAKNIHSTDIVILKNGEVKKYKVKRRGEKYVQIILI